jgi:probable F420-dependent oxidoreductase
MKLGLSPLQAGDFDETIQECEWAEAAGFDSAWLGEHHNHPLLYPTPLLGLAAIASRTRRLRLGTGVLLLPLYHPLAVAEEAAMVDVISGGRLILGVGAGYAPEEFAAFGVPMKERGSRMDEAVPLIHRLWSEEKVTHEGRHYQVVNATVAPRPVQRPRPPIWFGGWVASALRRAARLGDAWLAGPSATLDELAACVRVYREARQAVRREVAAADVALMRYVFVAESAERARDIAGTAFVRSFEATYFRWPHPVVKRPAGELTIERLSDDRIILGDPASCIRQIERFQDALGLSHLVCRFSVQGVPRDAVRASQELFARDVMPAIAGVSAPRAGTVRSAGE